MDNINLKYTNMNNTKSWKQQADLYSENAVIPPPLKLKCKSKTDKIKIIIDSRDRNTSVWKTPSSYSIKIENPLNNVTSIELCDYSIPLKRPLINNTNKTLYYSIDNGENIKTVTINEGNYTGTELAIELKARLGSDVSSITYNETTGKFKVVSNNDNFILKFSKNIKNNLSNIIGFSNQDYTTNSNIIESSYTINLKDENYIIMLLENAVTNTSNNQYINKSFAIIKDNTYLQETIKKNFSPAINNFSTFTIEFKDYYGNLYDFQNQEHRLEFIIETCNQT